MKSIVYFFTLLSANLSFAQKTITTQYYSTNTTKEQYQVNAQGLKNGFYKAYNIDGILAYAYNFKNGKEHGSCIDYVSIGEYGAAIHCYGKPFVERVMDDGKLVSEKIYKCANNNNYIISSQKLISLDNYEIIKFYQNGKIKEKSSFGELGGPYEKYYENGQLEEKGKNDGKGKFGNWVGFYENGDSLYFSIYTAGIATYYKYFYNENKIKEVGTIDENFENISITEYYVDGKLKSEKNLKANPFVYLCGRGDGSNDPKNWKELAMSGNSSCGGDYYNPYTYTGSYADSYILSEKIYNSNGEIESETINELRVINSVNVVGLKSDFEKEDVLLRNIEKEGSYESIYAYSKANSKFYYFKTVQNIFNEMNKKYDIDISKIKSEYLELKLQSEVIDNKIYRSIENSNSEEGNKRYEKFSMAHNFLSDTIKKQADIIEDLKIEISKFESILEHGDSSDVSKWNKKELLILVTNRLEIAKNLHEQTNKLLMLWDKRLPFLNDKDLQKSLKAATTPEQVLKVLGID